MSKADFSGRVRPDACPGALQVHTAADGALARVRLPGGAVSATQLDELASCADFLGSGVIELTSRANVQVRGLRDPAAFAARMAAIGLLPSATHERVRNIVASPVYGPSSVTDVQPLVTALDLAIRARPRLAELPGRFLFALDDGTGDVVGLGADVTLTWRAPDDRAGGVGAGQVLLAGADVGLAAEPGARAVTLMVAAAEAFLDERAAQNSAAWRIRELTDGPTRLAARLAPHATNPHATDPTAAEAVGGVGAPGVRRQRDGRVALEVVVPLGRLSAAQARALATAARTPDGEAPVRLTPWRTAIVPGLTPAQAAHQIEALVAAGLVADPASPWAGLTACTGSPGCAKSLADVQADAASWATEQETARHAQEAAHAQEVERVLPVHWVGCERRCGRPGGRVVEVVATPEGYRVEVGGARRTTGDMKEAGAVVAAVRGGT
ncbi:precorrin-3B synthase [Nonomuraea sp. NPDC046570]|uniref:precorrin-3B synthase n=1 Tax=Nonomuraea sp. NPDC046570 TaxID=3155255 RepID=UPI0033E7E32A